VVDSRESVSLQKCLKIKGLQRLPDNEILVKARIEGRVLLTVDLDFAQLLASDQKRYIIIK
jgi:predicted nuclease of predicted toxin-antitoxin system